ncbi:MAG TPA: serine hydrolase domain-containing protein [Vicinamibacteria bacterium]
MNPPAHPQARLFSFALVLIAWSAQAAAQPAPAGLPAGVQQRIETAIQAEMARDSIPGLSIAVAVDGVVRWANGYGMADLENSVPARAATSYRLASVAKPITATAVMQLVEAGKLDLDAPIQRYAPAFPQKPWPITARQLLSHLSGIRHYEEDEQATTRHYPTLVAALDMFKNDPLRHQPGTKYLYSTFGYTLLGVALEAAAGMPYADYVRTHVFLPAGMETIRVDEVAAIIPYRAQGYLKLPGGRLVNSALSDTSFKVPGGGLCGTVLDLARFAIAFQAGKLVKPATAEQMCTPNPVSLRRARVGDDIGYGMGWNVVIHDGERQPFHAGNQQRVTNLLFTRPQRRVVVAMMSNLENAHLTVVLARQISDLALEAK